MIEVYSGTRPGNRPRLLALLSLVLAGMLGLAWAQARVSRQLAPETAISGTPLRVRVPAGWERDPRDPGRFLAPVANGGANEPLRRSIRVSYERRPAFVPLDVVILQWNNIEKVLATSPLLPAASPLGGLRAGQVVRRRAVRFQNSLIPRETILRAAVSARGDVLRVEYAPASGFSPGDVELLDSVCASLRIDDPAFAPADVLLRRAGVRLPPQTGLRVCGPDFPQAYGVYAVAERDELPRFAVGIFRTWSTPEHPAEELLRGFAEQIWESALEPPEIAETGRPDGGRVLRMRHPQMGRTDHVYRSVRLVIQEDGELALLTAIALSADAREADFVAESLAARITLEKLESAPDIAAAQSRGERAARELRTAGAAAIWGRSTRRGFFLGELSWRKFISAWQIVPNRRSGAFEGRRIEVFAESGEPRVVQWVIDAAAENYTLRAESGQGRGAYFGTESRSASDARVRRLVRSGGRERQESFATGEAWVPAPLEDAALARAARAGGEAQLLEFSRSHGLGTSTVLCQPLPPDDKGHFRVLWLHDYWPQGRITAFDAKDEAVYEEIPGGRIERVDERTALRIAPILADYLSAGEPRESGPVVRSSAAAREKVFGSGRSSARIGGGGRSRGVEPALVGE